MVIYVYEHSGAVRQRFLGIVRESCKAVVAEPLVILGRSDFQARGLKPTPAGGAITLHPQYLAPPSTCSRRTFCGTDSADVCVCLHRLSASAVGRTAQSATDAARTAVAAVLCGQGIE